MQLVTPPSVFIFYFLTTVNNITVIIILPRKINAHDYFSSVETQSYSLKCRPKVDCIRSRVGCNKDDSTSLTTCTACCESDRCNYPTTFKGNTFIILVQY